MIDVARVVSILQKRFDNPEVISELSKDDISHDFVYMSTDIKAVSPLPHLRLAKLREHEK